MHRFFVDPEQIKDSIGKITNDDAHHIQRVLRLGVGEQITLCDGQGMDYLGLIQHIDKGLVEVKIVSETPNETEAKIKVSLLQGIPKASKMETIIQKCFEWDLWHMELYNMSKIDYSLPEF
jgi:16S rRNA (uracil1498-N3)-methyltransferase